MTKDKNKIVKEIMLMLLAANNNKPIESEEKLHSMMFLLSKSIPELGAVLNDWTDKKFEAAAKS